MLKKYWYYICILILTILPAIICQTVEPIIPEKTWEALSERLYATILGFQEVSETPTSKVVMIEVDDQKTIDAYGWPVDRNYYVKAFDKLRRSGHPWVLSLLHFQLLQKTQKGMASRRVLKAKDSALLRSIQRYDRVIGSGLEIDHNSELESDFEDEVMPRVTLSKYGKAPDELPLLPLKLVEDQEFVRLQKAFGFSTWFGLEPVKYCLSMVLTDGSFSGEFVVPSSLVWAAAYAKKARLVTPGGAVWPRKGEELPFSFGGNLNISYRHCLSSPLLETSSYLEKRQIKVMSLVDFLNSKKIDLTGKVVILGSSRGRVRGPGPLLDADKGMVLRHRLAARFLDDLMIGQSIGRGALRSYGYFGWLPLAIGLVFCGLLMFVSVGQVFTLAMLVLITVLGVSCFHLFEGTYYIPIQTIISMIITVLGLGGFFVYIHYQAGRRQMRFADRLRRYLSQCNNLEELSSLTVRCLKREFIDARLNLTDYDKGLYHALVDPAAALEMIDSSVRKKGEGTEQEQSEESKDRWIDGPPAATGVRRIASVKTDLFNACRVDAKISVAAKNKRLGSFIVVFSYRFYEGIFVPGLVKTIKNELAQHWNRIELLARQKIADYEMVAQQARGQILEKFLSQVLVSKFADNKTMEENLKTVLSPRPCKAALMQADIRGFSKISMRYTPKEMVQMLQKFYSNVVGIAQIVGQVKLIGDAIFLFIEDTSGRDGLSPADLALQICAILVEDTRRQNEINAKEGIEPVVFGMAIHAGDVVVGNLSSDECIDYTVIGTNVNMVARLEEATKQQAIRDVTMENGVVMSKEAAESLILYKDVQHGTINLAEMGLVVRSFDDVKEICYVTADDAAAIADPSIIKSLAD